MKFFEHTSVIIFISLNFLKICVSGAQKNHLLEAGLLSTHNINYVLVEKLEK